MGKKLLKVAARANLYEKAKPLSVSEDGALVTRLRRTSNVIGEVVEPYPDDFTGVVGVFGNEVYSKFIYPEEPRSFDKGAGVKYVDGYVYVWDANRVYKYTHDMHLLWAYAYGAALPSPGGAYTVEINRAGDVYLVCANFMQKLNSDGKVENDNIALSSGGAAKSTMHDEKLVVAERFSVFKLNAAEDGTEWRIDYGTLGSSDFEDPSLQSELETLIGSDSTLEPYGFYASGDHLYYAMRGKNRVIRINLNSGKIDWISSPSSRDIYVIRLIGDDVYIVDRDNPSVKKTKDGSSIEFEEVYDVGGSGLLGGFFDSSGGATLFRPHRIEKYSYDGDLIWAIDHPLDDVMRNISTDGMGHVYIKSASELLEVSDYLVLKGYRFVQGDD